jgi:hypothetical protein
LAAQELATKTKEADSTIEVEPAKCGEPGFTPREKKQRRCWSLPTPHP